MKKEDIKKWIGVHQYGFTFYYGDACIGGAPSNTTDPVQQVYETVLAEYTKKV